MGQGVLVVLVLINLICTIYLISKGKEFVIDTDEGQVRLARAYTCIRCCSFYTPRPERLLIDGDCYVMDFTGDRSAYEDYQELLGRKGERVCTVIQNSAMRILGSQHKK